MLQEKYRCFETKLAYHTAPSLLGIKCASLVSMPMDRFDIIEQTERFNAIAGGKGLKIKLMCHCKERTLILQYNEKLLSASLSDPDRREILQAYGYSKFFVLENDLDRLAERISSAEANEFPHEIGIFLGYPTEDVIGFIMNKGNNFKACGCWKVYGDVKKAERSFENYDKCRKFLCSKLERGDDIYHALKIS